MANLKRRNSPFTPKTAIFDAEVLHPPYKGGRKTAEHRLRCECFFLEQTMTSPTDRTTPAYREYVRALAETKREPARDRKRQHRATPDRARYPWPTDLDVFDPD